MQITHSIWSQPTFWRSGNRAAGNYPEYLSLSSTQAGGATFFSELRSTWGSGERRFLLAESTL